MAGVVGGMRIVACPTGSPLGLFVDMHEMEILLIVPEAGQCGGQLFTGKRLFVAHEAQLVIIRVVPRVEDRREIFPQHPEIVRTVGIVAARTVILPYGAMMLLVLCQQDLDIFQPTAWRVIGAVVTAEAEFGRLLGNKLGMLADVGFMAGHAPLFGIQALVLDT